MKVGDVVLVGMPQGFVVATVAAASPGALVLDYPALLRWLDIAEPSAVGIGMQFRIVLGLGFLPARRIVLSGEQARILATISGEAPDDAFPVARDLLGIYRNTVAGLTRRSPVEITRR